MYVSNRGQEIPSTDYWQTEHACRGYLYLSFNAGALRVLVPETAAGFLLDLPPAGTPCEYLQEGLPEEPGMPALVWEDNPSEPYRVAVSGHQVDRRLPEEDDGKEILLLWYVPDPERGPEAVREARRERLRVVVQGVAAGQIAVPEVLLAPSCCLEVFTVGSGRERVRVVPSRELPDTLATDSGAHWIPSPAGAWTVLARKARPPGTAS